MNHLVIAIISRYRILDGWEQANKKLDGCQGKKVKIVYGLPGQQFPLSTVAHVKALHTRSSALSLHNHEIGNPAPTATAITPPVLSRRKRANVCTVARSFSDGMGMFCSFGRKR